eukprot:CAMPEP_0172740044 /NCGR_PEP_ID=MMETSP1074-20121228/123943_1 /TAXON_ID=2916 /ORGANISM="Ceratium fusus, Strain PA161109" /LENGTH=63 /DNA_ID=CAMNT_0013570059 /DNA_START=60 /DNA_END=251 /DNA_ORIENTATION=-
MAIPSVLDGLNDLRSLSLASRSKMPIRMLEILCSRPSSTPTLDTEESMLDRRWSSSPSAVEDP